MADLTQDSAVRKLVADIEALTRRVNKLPSEVPIEYRADALIAMGQISRDREAIVHDYNEWNLAGMLTGTEQLLKTQRDGFEAARPYPYGSDAENEIIELAESIRFDWHQLRARTALAAV